MSFELNKVAEKIKKITLVLVFTLICINIYSYDCETFIDYNKTLKDTPFSVKTASSLDTKEDICTGEMIGKSRGTSLNNILNKRLNQNNSCRQLLSIVSFDVLFYGFGDSIGYDNVEATNIKSVHISVAEYIHKTDGKKRVVL